MIFNVPLHTIYIRNGLTSRPADNLNLPIELRIVKTQTRRLNRGIYKVGKDYAVQRKRGMKAESDIRIVMDRIWLEETEEYVDTSEVVISKEDAWAEGGYSPTKFEDIFMDANPKWNGWSRWAFKFHVVEV